MRAYESLIRVIHTLYEYAESCTVVVQGHEKSRGLTAPGTSVKLSTEVAEIVDFC
jgi:hypothetical protein